MVVVRVYTPQTTTANPTRSCFQGLQRRQQQQQVLEGDASLLQSTSTSLSNANAVAFHSLLQLHEVALGLALENEATAATSTAAATATATLVLELPLCCMWQPNARAHASYPTAAGPMPNYNTPALFCPTPLLFLCLSLFHTLLPSFNFQHAANFVFMQQISISCYKITRTCT